ncbi:trypsin-like [Cimex lectularius]|uniref:Peptidase S1 domain-containing protein n=1 Tax=Cimex lectularius TaxID=79782 RepID=A0A8I6RSB3_CIMLE|nr:trypsin-like [Cimex lectularius]
MLLYFFVFLFRVVLAYQGGKIFGGRYAKEGEFPFVVSVHTETDCAGSLVTLSKVVTAAHCFKYKADDQVKDVNLMNAWVTAGSIDEEKGSDEFDNRGIEMISVPNEYKYGSRWNGRLDSHDVGLVFLDYPFYAGRMLQPMKIVSRKKAVFKQKWDEIVAMRTVCYAMGWGTTAFIIIDNDIEMPSMSSSILKVIEVSPLPNKTCQAEYKPEDDMTMYGEICVKSIRENETICDGDSGGPLVCNGHSYAILTHGPKCGDSSSSQGYVLFWYYLDFLGLTEASTSTNPKCHLLLFFLPVLSKYT